MKSRFLILSTLLIVLVTSQSLAMTQNSKNIPSSGTIERARSALTPTIPLTKLRGVSAPWFVESNPLGNVITWSTTDLKEDEVIRSLDEMVKWKIKLLRLMMFVNWVLEDRQGFNNHIVKVTDLANERGITVQWSAAYLDRKPGDPWKTSGQPWNLMNEATANTYYTKLATLLKVKDVIIELWNEAVEWDASRLEQTAIPFFQRAVNSIRGAGFDGVIAISHDFGRFQPWLPMDITEWVPVVHSKIVDPLGSGKIVYVMNIYRWSGSLAYNDGVWRTKDYFKDITYSNIENALQMLWDMASKYPIMIKEIGAQTYSTSTYLEGGINDRRYTTDPEAMQRELDYFGITLDLLNQKGIGWVAWQWQEGDIDVNSELIDTSGGKWWGILLDKTTLQPNDKGIIVKEMLSAPII